MLPGWINLEFCYSMQMVGFRIWCQCHESMDLTWLSAVQAGGCVMVWKTFSWQTLFSNQTLIEWHYFSIVAKGVHPFLDTRFPAACRIPARTATGKLFWENSVVLPSIDKVFLIRCPVSVNHYNITGTASHYSEYLNQATAWINWIRSLSGKRTYGSPSKFFFYCDCIYMMHKKDTSWQRSYWTKEYKSDCQGALFFIIEVRKMTNNETALCCNGVTINTNQQELLTCLMVNRLCKKTHYVLQK